MKLVRFIRKAAFIMALLPIISLVSCTGGVSDITSEVAEQSTLTQAPETTDSLVSDEDEVPFYQVIYNSDTTCIEQVLERNVDLTRAMVEENVTEAIDAGADCFVCTPGHCWVPWWPSKYTSEHTAWYTEKYGATGNYSNPYWKYIQELGNDLIAQQLKVCRKNDVGFFISFRLNDAHMINKTDGNSTNIAFAAEIFVDHPEYRIGTMTLSNGQIRNEAVLDFRHEAVREYKLDLIRELIENYEIDGFELDFCRRFAFFNTSVTTEEQRVRIMTEFIMEVRAMLDAETAKDGRYRHLSVRIPAYSDMYGDMGIDLEAFEKAGVTIFNFTSSYFTDQSFELEPLIAETGDAYTYFELNYTTAYSTDDLGKQIKRRTTIEQYYTTALLAYEQGVDGISFFNFQYYRGDRVSELDKPYTEPPFEVIANVKNIDFLKNAAQHYFYGYTWKDLITLTWKLPATLQKGVPFDLSMNLVEPEGSWQEDGVFSLQSLQAISDKTIKVTVNGVELTAVPYSGPAYPNEYTQLLGTQSNYLCYSVPKDILREGKNEIIVVSDSSEEIELFFAELTIK